MYFDEDGDLAHEFYVEVHTSRGTIMRQEPLDRLRPQVGCIVGYISHHIFRFLVTVHLFSWLLRVLEQHMIW